MPVFLSKVNETLMPCAESGVKLQKSINQTYYNLYLPKHTSWKNVKFPEPLDQILYLTRSIDILESKCIYFNLIIWLKKYPMSTFFFNQDLKTLCLLSVQVIITSANERSAFTILKVPINLTKPEVYESSVSKAWICILNI